MCTPSFTEYQCGARSGSPQLQLYIRTYHYAFIRTFMTVRTYITYVVHTYICSNNSATHYACAYVRICTYLQPLPPFNDLNFDVVLHDFSGCLRPISICDFRSFELLADGTNSLQTNRFLEKARASKTNFGTILADLCT